MQFILEIIAAVLSFIIACFNSLLGFFSPNPAVVSIRQNLAMDIKPGQVEFYEDTHGWFGDGEEVIIFTPDSAQIYKIYHHWENTPVDSGITSLIFSETEYNGVNLQNYIRNTEGFWFYKNRNSFSDGYSYNFSFAFFDGEKVYYYELDT